MIRTRATLTGVALLAGALTLSACGEREQTPPPAQDASGEPRSIFAEGGEEGGGETLGPPAPLDVQVYFPEGVELSEGARAELATVLESPQMAQGQRIILRGHSDSGGSDEANLRSSRERAEAVRDFLVDAGVAEERITIIAFGEQNPIEPNALPDGKPNGEGRAANRRVEIHVATSPTPEAVDKPTLAETLASELGDEGANGTDEPES
ncbi:OmpA family protein [Qipengyuania sp. 6B39]|uniref:OmpA family protein n=1 Tax=Qipengyuania proteolytica TaxID=2867239 RepID=UPI001C8AC916|nr:OmpA family protein [Qipengyuania proteolytica]MBX7494513.1 OmpA family protein [Qipengyuania proteolytica]